MKNQNNFESLTLSQPKSNDNERWMVFDVKETRKGSCKFKLYWISNHGRSAITYSYKDGVKELKQYATSSKNPKKQYLAFASNDLSFKYVHQAVSAMFVPNSEPDRFIVTNHIDGDRMNNHHTNLEHVTYRGNIHHWMGTANYKML